MTTRLNNTWTNQLYQMAEFLYWEPQRINRQKRTVGGGMTTFTKSIDNLHTLEVPLNMLFNMMLRLAPQRIKRSILGCFEGAADFGTHIELADIYHCLNYETIDFIQPDTIIESETARVCIELKVDASLELNQVYKYLSLLGLWQEKVNTLKAPCLFFLTRKNLRAQWGNEHREKIFSNENHLAALEQYLKLTDPPRVFKWASASDNHYERIKAILPHMRLGWITWQDLGHNLFAEWQSLSQIDPTESEQMLDKLLGDFLSELEERRLWKGNLTEAVGGTKSEQ